MDFSFSLTTFLFYIIYLKAKIIGVTDIFLNPFAHEQWSFNSSKGSAEHGLYPNWLGVQTRMPCFKVGANINEGIVFKVFCWLCCLSKWGVGPLKRGSHLSVQGQQSWSGEPHCASLITKNSLHNGTHLISMGQWTVCCQLLLVLYIQSISPFL